MRTFVSHGSWPLIWTWKNQTKIDQERRSCWQRIDPLYLSWVNIISPKIVGSAITSAQWKVASVHNHNLGSDWIRFIISSRSDNFRIKSWSHCFSQNTNKKLSWFLPSLHKAEILTIFCSYFGKNDDFINPFWK